MQLAAQLEATLREFAASSAIEIRENSGRSIPFQGLSWEVRGAPEKPLLHLWSEQYNLTRRVLAITDRSEARLALAVERFGRGKPDRLEFVRLDFERPARVSVAVRFLVFEVELLRKARREWNRKLIGLARVADVDRSYDRRGTPRCGFWMFELLPAGLLQQVKLASKIPEQGGKGPVGPGDVCGSVCPRNGNDDGMGYVFDDVRQKYAERGEGTGILRHNDSHEAERPRQISGV